MAGVQHWSKFKEVKKYWLIRKNDFVLWFKYCVLDNITNSIPMSLFIPFSVKKICARLRKFCELLWYVIVIRNMAWMSWMFWNACFSTILIHIPYNFLNSMWSWSRPSIGRWPKVRVSIASSFEFMVSIMKSRRFGYSFWPYFAFIWLTLQLTVLTQCNNIISLSSS